MESFAPPFGASGSIISDSSWNTNAGDQTLSYVDLSATNLERLTVKISTSVCILTL